MDRELLNLLVRVMGIFVYQILVLVAVFVLLAYFIVIPHIESSAAIMVNGAAAWVVSSWVATYVTRFEDTVSQLHVELLAYNERVKRERDEE